MATTFTLVTDTTARIESLFDVSLDIDIHAASMSKSKERAIAGVTSGRIGLGETVTWRARHFGLWFTMTSRITSLDRPHSFTDQQVKGPFKSFHHEHAFTETTSGTRMVDTITVASPMFGVLAERLVLMPYLRRLIKVRNAELVSAAR
ncbi:hypothetical protein GCM10010401_10940 [Rarobacter faecitabidus]|uniref:Polyketide cyclase/dehydrase/lipid transport protein n=1 Tax=Rarobacter faecitabidus TaxID=13243 RepID=A0A542ZP78_RARFA|nr:SRPBCC family protein [Rarobacter faecitabidus]TQL62163.1 hypothetical protein FB461_1801 [Rarobacter faecitabidus]